VPFRVREHIANRHLEQARVASHDARLRFDGDVLARERLDQQIEAQRLGVHLGQIRIEAGVGEHLLQHVRRLVCQLGDGPLDAARFDGGHEPGHGRSQLVDRMRFRAYPSRPRLAQRSHPHHERLRAADGTPNGVLVDAAGEWPWDHALAPSPELDAINHRALLDGMAHDNEYGITSASDARVYWGRGYLDAYRRAEERGEMTVRMVLGLWAYPSKNDDTQIATLARMRRDDGGMVRQTQIKIYADGLTQNTTAALLEPYRSKTLGAARGLDYFDAPRLARCVRELQAAGFDMHIHTIGDRGVRQALDAIEAARALPGGAGARHRLTHVELVHPGDVPRFRTLGVFADVQLAEENDPEHLHELEPFIGAERMNERAWRVRDLYASGATVTLSSDYDVGDLNPFAGMQRALTRGAQSLPNIDAALRAYTVNAARLMRSETRTGSLEVGKRADMIVVDRDIYAIPVERIAGTRVLRTMVDGREVYVR